VAPLKQGLLVVLRFPFAFAKGFDAVHGAFELVSRQQLGDREDLDATLTAREIFRFVKALRRSFDRHLLDWLAERD